MAVNEDHQFDRRSTDANVAALSVRVSGLERRMENVEKAQTENTRELQANTQLTKQAHAMIEEVRQNTVDIVEAVKWLSTSRKVIFAGVTGTAGTAGAIYGVVQVLKVTGWL